MDQYAPLRFGARTWIVPWNHELPAEADVRGCGGGAARSRPRLRFRHAPDHRRCACNGSMRWPTQGELQGRDVLDFGCGSGILALAALKLGAARAVGVDNDPQALLATHDNAERNGVGDALAVFLPQDEPVATYPVVVANILASALDALAETLAARVAPGGRIALSGILDGQQDALLQRYRAWFDALAGGDRGRLGAHRRRAPRNP